MTVPEDPGLTPPPAAPATPPAGPPPAASPPPPYGYQQPGYLPGRAPRNGLGTAALVIGIVSVLAIITVFGGVVLGILAIVFGIIGRGRAKRGEATNKGAATAGIILGAVGLVASIAIIAAGVGFFEHHKKDLTNLQSCLDNAQTQAQRDSCNQQFSNNVTH